MLPIRHRSIFKNRWIALLWAGGIIWTALEVSSPNQASPTQAIDDAAVNAEGNAAKAQLSPDEQAAINTLGSWGH